MRPQQLVAVRMSAEAANSAEEVVGIELVSNWKFRKLVEESEECSRVTLRGSK